MVKATAVVLSYDYKTTAPSHNSVWSRTMVHKTKFYISVSVSAKFKKKAAVELLVDKQRRKKPTKDPLCMEKTTVSTVPQRRVSTIKLRRESAQYRIQISKTKKM